MNRLLILLIMTGVAGAHNGHLFPFYELTDEMLETIDIHDGLIDEWYEVGEPCMTTLDFKTVRDQVPFDPSNLDFQIWLAWHEELNRIYVAVIVADDEHKNWDRIDFAEDGIDFYLDADHSGGRGYLDVLLDGTEVATEKVHLMWGQTQRYRAIPQATSEGTRITGGGYGWRIHPPYGDAGGEAAGENPTIWIIEMYVTPFNQWGYSVEETTFGELSAHRIVGFALVITDYDRSKDHTGTIEWNPEAIEDMEALHYLGRHVAEIFLDGLLFPAQETAVESLAWGRIKASLQ